MGHITCPILKNTNRLMKSVNFKLFLEDEQALGSYFLFNLRRHFLLLFQTKVSTVRIPLSFSCSVTIPIHIV